MSDRHMHLSPAPRCAGSRGMQSCCVGGRGYSKHLPLLAPSGDSAGQWRIASFHSCQLFTSSSPLHRP